MKKIKQFVKFLFFSLSVEFKLTDLLLVIDNKRSNKQNNFERNFEQLLNIAHLFHYQIHVENNFVTII